MNYLTKELCGLAVMLVLAMSSANVYAAIAGHVQFVHGKVQLTTSTGVTHAIKKGDAVNEGDTLFSSPSASAQIRMEDGGIVAMRPDTKLKIDQFTFNGQQDGSERSFFSLLQGGFRGITGLIGKKNKANYRIITPATTIGIRGTDHETFVITQDSPLSEKSPVGTYDKVNLGETIMTTAKGTINIMPNQMGFAGAGDQMPQLQSVNLDIFTVPASPSLQSGDDKRDGQHEGGRELRESTGMDRSEMRETAPLDRTEEKRTMMIEHEGINAAAPIQSSDDAVTNTITTTKSNE